MIFKRKQPGFTLFELAIVFVFIAAMCINAYLFYVIFHFIMKFW